ncbi:hypothetical protein GCM10010376_95890 [Streptomyces violaceusniger]
MSMNRAFVPTCLPIVLRRCHAFRVKGDFRVDASERLAWQPPYGPPPPRAHRGRWAPVPVPARSRSALRRGYPCGRDR